MAAPSLKAYLSLTVIGLTAAAPAIAAAPSVAPSPVPAPAKAAITALKEIGHVRAETPFCQSVFDAAGVSTKTALDNDSTIADTSAMLKVANLDEDAMARPKAILEMQQTYEALMARSRDSIGVMKALIKTAADAPTADQKAALIAYANALSGVIHRQEIVARDYREFGVYLEAHDPVSWQQHDRDLMAQNIVGYHPGEYGLTDARDRVEPFLADSAKNEATHLTEIHQRVIDDEVDAGSNVPAAFGPCHTDAATP